MGNRGLTAVVALSVTIGMFAAAASAGGLEVSIPGLSGPNVHIPSAQRIANGGGILVAKIAARLGSRLGSTVTAQLQPDGSLDLAYGNGGLATLGVTPAFTPTALTINPSTGEAWIGAASGVASELVAVSGNGEPEEKFGQHGVLYLPRQDDGGIAGLAWQAGRLLVSAGTGAGCGGCEVSLLSSISGARLTSYRLSASKLGAGAMCTEVVVTSVVFTGSHRELMGTRVPNRPGCSATVTALGPNLVPVPSSITHPTANPIRQLRSTTVASADGTTCVATTSGRGISIFPYGATNTIPVTPNRPNSLIALVSLGDAACSALIGRSSHGAVVAQASGHRPRPTLSYLPAGIAPQTMFRCHAHLLAIGTSGPADDRSTEIVPVPISRGPFASSADWARSAVAATATGCS